MECTGAIVTTYKHNIYGYVYLDAYPENRLVYGKMTTSLCSCTEDIEIE